jgi:uncharacterized membrane protein (DUF2068 family)
MQRPVWVTSIIILQLLLGALFAGVCIYLLFLIRSPEMKQGPAEGILGLKIAVGIIAPMALLVIVAAWGMWKARQWGWWFALLTNLALAVTFVYSSIDDGRNNLDWEMVAMTAVIVGLIIFLLLPQVRGFYLRRDQSHLPSAVTLGD